MMQRGVLVALMLLAAGASDAPAQSEWRGGPPSRGAIAAMVHEEMEFMSRAERDGGASVANEVLSVDNLSCRASAEDDCFDCSYAVTARQTIRPPGQDASVQNYRDEREDLVCRYLGDWIAMP